MTIRDEQEDKADSSAPDSDSEASSSDASDSSDDDSEKERMEQVLSEAKSNLFKRPDTN